MCTLLDGNANPWTLHSAVHCTSIQFCEVARVCERVNDGQSFCVQRKTSPQNLAESHTTESLMWPISTASHWKHTTLKMMRTEGPHCKKHDDRPCWGARDKTADLARVEGRICRMLRETDSSQTIASFWRLNKWSQKNVEQVWTRGKILSSVTRRRSYDSTGHLLRVLHTHPLTLTRTSILSPARQAGKAGKMLLRKTSYSPVAHSDFHTEGLSCVASSKQVSAGTAQLPGSQSALPCLFLPSGPTALWVFHLNQTGSETVFATTAYQNSGKSHECSPPNRKDAMSSHTKGEKVKIARW